MSYINGNYCSIPPNFDLSFQHFPLFRRKYLTDKRKLHILGFVSACNPRGYRPETWQSAVITELQKGAISVSKEGFYWFGKAVRLQPP